MEAIEHPPILRLPGIPDHVTYTWLIMVILAGLTFVASRNLQLVPRGLQNFLEVVLEQFQQMIEDVMGPKGRPYLPLIATLGLFILAGNLMGLVPGLIGVTGNLNTNAACAIVVFIAYHWIGARKQGLMLLRERRVGLGRRWTDQHRRQRCQQGDPQSALQAPPPSMVPHSSGWAGRRKRPLCLACATPGG